MATLPYMGGALKVLVAVALSLRNTANSQMSAKDERETVVRESTMNLTGQQLIRCAIHEHTTRVNCPIEYAMDVT
jgi:hypothetical protein